VYENIKYATARRTISQLRQTASHCIWNTWIDLNQNWHLAGRRGALHREAVYAGEFRNQGQGAQTNLLAA